MRKLSSLFFFVILAMSFVACSSKKEEEPAAAATNSYEVGTPIDKNFKFATLSVGSSWYVYGATIADVVSRKDSGLKFDVMPNSGGVGNMLLLQNNQADIGLGFSCVTNWAYNGERAFEKTGAIKQLRGLVGALDQMYVGIAIRNGSSIENISDIAEKKLPINLYTSETGSASEYTTRLVLESIGCTYEDIISWGGSVVHTDFASIIAAYQDGKCDMFMQHVSVGHAAFTELCTTADVRVGELPEASLDFLKQRGYGIATMPANSFNKQEKDVLCAGVSTCLLTTDALSDEAAYRIVKQVYENKDQLVLGHSGFAGFNKDTCGNSDTMGSVPLHPGAEKYYKEIGLLK